MGELKVLRALADAVEANEPVALATVVATRHSVPRHAGSKMLVRADGSAIGTIGGGEMERRVTEAAMAALRSGVATLEHFSLVDPGAGDPGVCGGEVDIYLEPYMPTTTLFIIGAGHVGQAVAGLASWLGYRSVVWDDRAELLEEAAADEAFTGSIDDAIGQLSIGPSTAIVVVTRNVQLDEEVLPSLLSTDAGYVGVMGSARRWATTRKRLEAAGIAADALDRVQAPIGIEIEAETPEEIAVSILAEVIGHGRTD